MGFYVSEKCSIYSILQMGCFYKTYQPIIGYNIKRDAGRGQVIERGIKYGAAENDRFKSSSMGRIRSVEELVM